jgi:fatty acid desaturase
MTTLTAHLLDDPRDAPFLRLIAFESLAVIPLAIALLTLGQVPWWLYLVYLVVMFSTFDRFILMLHCTSHRRLFKRRFGGLNGYVPRVLAPFFGQTPNTYYAHHVGMHHPENNLKDDISSTMRYERDSVIDFLRYLARFLFGIMPDLTRYMISRNRKRIMVNMLSGEIGWMALSIALMFVNPIATLVVFVLPYVVSRCLMMAGNWAQHAFVDPSDPANPHKNSITCIDCPYNERCFNDGFHVGHHIAPTLHWTEYPRELELNRARYAAEDAIIFRGIDFFTVWLFLMLKRYDWLARRVVVLEGRERNEAEIITWLKSRTRPIR